jgi:hypothetical protein
MSDIHSRVEALAGHTRGFQMTPEERLKQRVSLIMGLRSESSTLTREKVEEILTGVEGSTLTNQ